MITVEKPPHPAPTELMACPGGRSIRFHQDGGRHGEHQRSRHMDGQHTGHNGDATGLKNQVRTLMPELNRQ